MDSKELKPAEQSARNTTRPLQILPHFSIHQQAILDSFPAYIWIKGKNNEILYANETAAQTLGVSKETLSGSATKTFYPDEAEQYWKDDLEVLSTGVPKRGIIEPVVVREGKKRWVRTDKIPYRDGRGEIIGVIVFSIDITDQIEMEQELQNRDTQLRLLLENVPAILWAVDTQYIIRLSTGRTLRNIGIKPDALVGKTLFDYLNTTDPNHPDVLTHARALAGESVTNESEVQGRHLISQIEPIRNSAGEVTHVVGIGVDLTEIKEQERRLQTIADELTRSNQDLESFAHVVSHDLQEPLRLISWYLTLLNQRFGNQLELVGQQYIDYASAGARRMSELIRDLLAYSRVNNGELDRNVDLNDVVSTVLTNLKPMISESGAEIRSEELPRVYADPLQLSQVFQNLIGNAIKFRGSDSPRIEIGCKKQEKCLEFWVKDNGIGIPREAFDRIFVVFQRLHPREKYPGTGVGLAICKRIIERHGGRMWVESIYGKGSTFRFTLPASKSTVQSADSR